MRKPVGDSTRSLHNINSLLKSDRLFKYKKTTLPENFCNLFTHCLFSVRRCEIFLVKRKNKIKFWAVV